MQAIEFKAEVHDGIIGMPPHHGNWSKQKVKAVLLADDEPALPITRRSVFDARSPSRHADAGLGHSVTALKDMVHRLPHPVSIEQMNLAIATQGARAR